MRKKWRPFEKKIEGSQEKMGTKVKVCREEMKAMREAWLGEMEASQ
jgi:hypothetical protein